MLRCDRCGSGFSASHLMALEYCPRCLGKKEATSHLVSLRPTYRAVGGTETRSCPISVGDRRMNDYAERQCMGSRRPNPAVKSGSLPEA